MNEDLTALEAFVVDNDDLEKLESFANRFNIFEAVGVVHQELRHSDTLSFLLDPRGNHHLGDAFLSRFLKSVVQDGDCPVSVIDIDVADLASAEVRREWSNIDIFVLATASRLACVIENKIGAKEGPGQLTGYRETVERAFPDHKLVLVYLTPDGDPPSDEMYTAMSYGTVREIVDQVLADRADGMHPDVAVLLKHYSEMIGGRIVSDSDVAETCRRIYAKHKRALDLIFEHKPDLSMELKEVIDELLSEAKGSHGITSNQTSKRYQVFRHPDLAGVTEGFHGAGWESVTDVFFEFENFDKNVDIVGYISEHGDQRTRDAVWEFVQCHPDVFRGQHNRLNTKATAIYKLNVLKPEDIDDLDVGILTMKIRQAWDLFLDRDFRAVREKFGEFDFPRPDETGSDPQP